MHVVVVGPVEVQFENGDHVENNNHMNVCDNDSHDDECSVMMIMMAMMMKRLVMKTTTIKTICIQTRNRLILLLIL